MLKIHRYVSVDRGVEALLDHAILEGEARFAFGVLIGRLASPNASSGNTNGEEDWQFHLTHALPVAAGKDVVDSNFLRLLNGLLVGGLRVAGLYSIWSTGGAGAAAATELERLCQAAFPALPMVMLEKLEGSHEVKARLFNRERGTSEPAEIKYAPVLADSLRRVACDFAFPTNTLLYDPAARHVCSSSGASPSSTIAASVQRSATAILSSAIAVTSKAGIPLEAHPSAHALKTTSGVCRLSLYATTTSTLLPEQEQATPAKTSAREHHRAHLKAVRVDGVIKCEAVVCCSEPAAAALESIGQDIQRSLSMRFAATTDNDDDDDDDAAKLPPLLSRFAIEVGGSESLLSSSVEQQSGKKTKRNNARNNSVLPLISVYTLGRDADPSDKVAQVLTAIGLRPEERTVFECSSADGATRTTRVQQGNSFNLSPWLDSTQALAACHTPTDTPTTATRAAIDDAQAAGSDDEVEHGIEVVDDGAAAPEVVPLDMEDKGQRSAAETKDEGVLRQRKRTQRDGEQEEEEDDDDDEDEKKESPTQLSSKPKGVRQVAAEALQEELKYAKHSVPATAKANSSQNTIMVVVVGVAILAVVFALLMAVL